MYQPSCVPPNPLGRRDLVHLCTSQPMYLPTYCAAVIWLTNVPPNPCPSQPVRPPWFGSPDCVRQPMSVRLWLSRSSQQMYLPRYVCPYPFGRRGVAHPCTSQPMQPSWFGSPMCPPTNVPPDPFPGWPIQPLWFSLPMYLPTDVPSDPFSRGDLAHRCPSRAMYTLIH